MLYWITGGACSCLLVKGKIMAAKIDLDKEFRQAIHTPSVDGVPLYKRCDGQDEKSVKKTAAWHEKAKGVYSSPHNVRVLCLTCESVYMELYRPDAGSKSITKIKKLSNSDIKMLCEAASQGQIGRTPVTKCGLGALVKPWVLSDIEEIYFDSSVLLAQEVEALGFAGMLYRMNEKGHQNFGGEYVYSLFSKACLSDAKQEERFPRLRAVGYIQRLSGIVKAYKQPKGGRGMGGKLWGENEYVMSDIKNPDTAAGIYVVNKKKVITRSSLSPNIYIFDREVLKPFFDSYKSSNKDSTVSTGTKAAAGRNVAAKTEGKPCDSILKAIERDCGKAAAVAVYVYGIGNNRKSGIQNQLLSQKLVDRLDEYAEYGRIGDGECVRFGHSFLTNTVNAKDMERRMQIAELFVRSDSTGGDATAHAMAMYTVMRHCHSKGIQNSLTERVLKDVENHPAVWKALLSMDVSDWVSMIWQCSDGEKYLPKVKNELKKLGITVPEAGQMLSGDNVLNDNFLTYSNLKNSIRNFSGMSMASGVNGIAAENVKPLIGYSLCGSIYGKTSSGVTRRAARAAASDSIMESGTGAKAVTRSTGRSKAVTPAGGTDAAKPYDAAIKQITGQYGENMAAAYYMYGLGNGRKDSVKTKLFSSAVIDDMEDMSFDYMFSAETAGMKDSTRRFSVAEMFISSQSVMGVSATAAVMSMYSLMRHCYSKGKSNKLTHLILRKIGHSRNAWKAVLSPETADWVSLVWKCDAGQQYIGQVKEVLGQLGIIVPEPGQYLSGPNVINDSYLSYSNLSTSIKNFGKMSGTVGSSHLSKAQIELILSYDIRQYAGCYVDEGSVGGSLLDGIPGM